MITTVLVHEPKKYRERPIPTPSREDFWFDESRRILYVDFQKTCSTCVRIGSWDDALTISRWNPVYEFWQEEDWDPGI